MYSDKIRCVLIFFILTSLNSDEWLTRFQINSDKPASLRARKLEQKRLKNLDWHVFPNNDRDRRKIKDEKGIWNHLERKPRESNPDIKSIREFLSRLEPHRFLKTKAENPKQILKKKLIR